METENKYLTISEFAKQVGLSRQYVYSLLDNTLQEYMTKQGNKKVISTEALKLFDDNKKCKQDCHVTSKLTLVDSLQNEIEYLREELAKAQTNNRELTAKVTKLLENNQIIQLRQLEDKQKLISDTTEVKKIPFLKRIFHKNN